MTLLVSYRYPPASSNDVMTVIVIVVEREMMKSIIRVECLSLSVNESLRFIAPVDLPLIISRRLIRTLFVQDVTNKSSHLATVGSNREPAGFAEHSEKVEISGNVARTEKRRWKES